MMRYFNMDKRVLFCNTSIAGKNVYVGLDNLKSRRPGMQNRTTEYDPETMELFKSANHRKEVLLKLKESVNFDNIDMLFVTAHGTNYKLINHRFTDKEAMIYRGDVKNTERLKIGKHTYVLDSTSLHNVVTASGKGHGIAGVTCGGERYLYNGWMKRVAVEGGKSRATDTPCQLIPYDWLKENGDFCLNSITCGLDNSRAHKTKMCFNPKKGERTYTYVKEPAKSDSRRNKEPLNNVSLIYKKG